MIRQTVVVCNVCIFKFKIWEKIVTKEESYCLINFFFSNLHVFLSSMQTSESVWNGFKEDNNCCSKKLWQKSGPCSDVIWTSSPGKSYSTHLDPFVGKFLQYSSNENLITFHANLNCCMQVCFLTLELKRKEIIEWLCNASTIKLPKGRLVKLKLKQPQSIHVEQHMFRPRCTFFSLSVSGVTSFTAFSHLLCWKQFPRWLSKKVMSFKRLFNSLNSHGSIVKRCFVCFSPYSFLSSVL